MGRGKRSSTDGPAHRDTVPLTPEIGAILNDRYELVELLGQGAHGLVFRARDRVAAETVALKLLAIDPRVPGRLEWLRRELRTARKVSHPNVVRIHDLVEIGVDQLALSMELVIGETLEAKLTRGPLPPDEWIVLAQELATALAAAHEAGVAHRDLKPSNILLRKSNGRAVITDFGVSRLMDLGGPLDAATTRGSGEVALSANGQLVGTPQYMAPEQLAGRSIGAPADVYSLGIVLYEAALGRRPHLGETIAALVESRVTAAPPLATVRSDLPPGMCRSIDRMLAYDPDQRPQLYEITGRTSSQPLIAPPVRRGPRPVVIGLFAAIVAAWLAVLVVWAPWRTSTATHGTFRIAVKTKTDKDTAGIEAAVDRMALRAFTNDLRLEPGDPADATLAITVRRSIQGAQLSIVADVAGRSIDLGDVVAPSVAGALELAAPKVAALAKNARPRGPTPAEVAVMAVLQTQSFEAYRQYAAADRASFTTSATDPAAVEELYRRALALDPKWVHPYVAIALARGLLGDAAIEMMRAARATADPTRDPRGWKLVEAIELYNRGKVTEARAIVAAVADPLDINGMWILMNALYFEDDVDGEMAVTRRLYDQRPDLQFGYDILVLLYQNGRANEVPALIKAWRVRAPENEQALAAEANMAAIEARWADAEKGARDLLFLHGDQPHRLLLYCDVLINSGHAADAHALVDRLVAGDAVARAHGLYRLGVMAVLEGRFASAYESLKDAFKANLPIGINGETTQVLEALRGLAWLGPKGDLLHWTEELARVHEIHGAAANAAAMRFEAALLKRKESEPCPDIEAALSSITVDRQRSWARIVMTRSASQNGCASCGDVVHAGMSFRETLPSSLLVFGACAEQEGAFDLATHAYDDVIAHRNTYGIGVGIDAPYEWVLAAYYRARLAERLGDVAGARVRYQQVLDRWGKADRRIPEVAQSRDALSRLHL